MTFVYFQPAVGFSEIVEAIKSLGFPVVVTVLLMLLVISPLFVLARVLMTQLGAKIDGAVTLFSGTLSNMSTRQESTSDKLAEAITKHAEVQSRTNELLAGLVKGQDITLRFITENMVQIASHRQAVEIEGSGAPLAGVIKSVAVEEEKHNDG